MHTKNAVTKHIKNHHQLKVLSDKEEKFAAKVLEKKHKTEKQAQMKLD